MKLIIVRHGETEENVMETMQGHRHGKLTEVGKEQAKKLALRLKDEKIDVIISSDLQRAKDTVKEIAKFHKVPIHYTSELRERSVGIFEGKLREKYYKHIEESGIPIAEFKPDGGESYVELRERAKKFLTKLFKKYKHKTILICSHGGCIRMLMGILLKKPIEEAIRLDQSNACVNIIEIGSGNKAYIINCIRHL